MSILYVGIILGIIVSVIGIGLYGTYLDIQEIQKPWDERDGPNSFAYMRGVTAERDYIVCTLSLYPQRCHSDFPAWYLDKLEERRDLYLEDPDYKFKFLLADRISPEPEHSIYSFTFEGNEFDYDPWEDPNFIMCEDPRDPRCDVARLSK